MTFAYFLLPGRRAAWLLWLSLSLLLPASLQGQTSRSATDGHSIPDAIQPGAPASSYIWSGIEDINLYNGHVNFRFPLVEIRGRGEARYTLTGVINRPAWRVESLYFPSINDWQAYPSENWWRFLEPGYGPGVVEGRNTGRDPLTTCGDPTPIYFRETFSYLVFTAPDGTETMLYDTDFGQLFYTCTTVDNRTRGRTFRSNDGSGMTFVSDSNIVDDNHIDSYAAGPPYFLPNGYLITRDGVRRRVEGGLIRWLRDRNGNKLSFDYVNTRVTRVVDSLNREVLVNYSVQDVAPYGLCDQIISKGFGGAQRIIRLSKTNLQGALRAGAGYTVKRYNELFPELSGAGASFFNPLVVSSVWLPNGLRYQFFYNPYREVERVVLPTSGVIEYSYAAGLASGWYSSGQIGSDPFGESDPPNVSVYRRLIERREYADGTNLSQRTTYSRPESISCQNVGYVSVESFAPDGARLKSERHSFHGRPACEMALGPVSDNGAATLDGREHQLERFHIDGVTAMRRESHTWQIGTGVPQIAETLTTLADTNQVSKQTFLYDIYNNRTQIDEYGYGAASWTRRTQIAYVTSAAYTDVSVHLRSLPLQESVYDASGERARTVYEYDNYANDGGNHAPLVPRASMSGRLLDIDGNDIHGTGYTTRGNVTRTGRWLDTTNTTIYSYQQYDMAGNVVKAIDARGAIATPVYATSFGYNDAFGAPNAEARANTAPGELGGQSSFAFPTQVTNPFGHASYTQYDYYLGTPVDAEDANGAVTSTAFSDPLDRITQVVRANNMGIRNQTAVSYNDVSRIVTTTSDRDTYLDNQLKTELVYDGLGRTVETRQYESGTGYITTKRNYDAMGRVREVSNPYRPASESLLWTTTTYDALSRVTRVTTPDLAMVDTLYQGNEAVVVDQAAKQRKTTTDALGRLFRVTEDPLGLAYQTNYTYDVLDNLKTVQQGGQTRTFVYDSLGRLRSAMNPENGTVNYAAYDENGNLLQKADARGTITYTYDALNRLKSRSYTDGTPMVTLQYDAPTVACSKGRLTKVISTVSEYGYDEYDCLGRVKRSSQVTNGRQYLFSYGYNLAGGMTSQTYPSLRTVSTGYDTAGRVSTVSGVKTGEPNKTYAPSIGYAAHGAVNALQLGNGRIEQTCFNNRLQPERIRLRTVLANCTTSPNPDANDLLHLSYFYGTTDNNGNVLKQTITAPGISPLTQFYKYDSLNRLEIATERTIGEGALCPDSGSQWCQKFGYDQYGNRWVTTGSYIPNTTLTPQAQTAFNAGTNKLTGGLWSYLDGVTTGIETGNLTRDNAGNTYSYDLENRQKTFNGTAATYSYDGEGRRVKKKEPGGTTIFVYDAQGQLAAEYSETAPSETSGTKYLTADHLASTRVLTTAAGAVWKRYDYLPFGEEIPASIGGRSSVTGYSATDPTRQKFTGKERDAESGLDYFGARYFSGAQGRFTSPDPFSILQEAGGREELDEYLSEPKHWNKYVYSLNNPLKYIDPDGNHPVLVAARELLQRYGPQAYVWATRFFNSSKGQQITQGAIETISGVPLGMSISPRSVLAREVNVALQSVEASVRLEGQVAAKFVNQLEGFRKTVSVGGKVVGEIDVELKNAIIEVTTGEGGHKVAQARRLLTDPNLNPSGKSVIVFGSNLSKGVIRELQKIGAKVATTQEELEKLLRER